MLVPGVGSSSVRPFTSYTSLTQTCRPRCSVDLADHAAAQILLGVFAKADIAGLGIAQRPAVGGALALLVDIEDLQTGAVRIDVGHMHRIAVAELGAGPAVRQGAVFGVEQASVMVDGCCAVHNFHAAVPINVSSRNAVVALPGQNAVHRSVPTARWQPLSLKGFAIGTKPESIPHTL